MKKPEETEEKTVSEKPEKKKIQYNFPSLGKTVESESYEEALSIINKK